MKPDFLAGASIGETLSEFVRQAATSGARIEHVRFSGLATDVSISADAIYLRCTTMRIADSEGNPGELWGRLQGIGGLWMIPRVACEVVILIPQDVETPGVGWVLATTADTPPTGVSQTVARLVFDTETTLQIQAKDVTVNGGTLEVARKTDGVAIGTLTATCAAAPGPVTFTFTPSVGAPQAGASVTLSGAINGGAAHFKA